MKDRNEGDEWKWVRGVGKQWMDEFDFNEWKGEKKKKISEGAEWSWIRIVVSKTVTGTWMKEWMNELNVSEWKCEIKMINEGLWWIWVKNWDK